MDEPFQQEISSILLAVSVGDSFNMIISLVVIMILLLCSALISGSEVAYFSLGPVERNLIENDPDKHYTTLNNLLLRPKRLLATILIANNFVNVAIVIISTYVSDMLIPSDYSELTQFIIQVIVVTFLLLLLGEVIPKIYANKNPLTLAKIMALPIYYLRSLLTPLSSVLVNSTTFIDKRIKKRGHNISVDELSQALELTSNENKTDEDQKILEGIVKFGNTDVKQVMTSRVDVVSIEKSFTFQEVINNILESGFSRIPVQNESFDKIIGVLFIKDLLPHLSKEKFDWLSLIRKPFFVPENKKIDDLLKEFQTKKTHLAVVVDEYGGSSGVISLEDILEEIVGEISDEFDDDDLTYSKIDEYNYVFEGKTQLNDVYRVLEIEGDDFEAEKGESETIAGLTLELFGKIPKKNEKLRFNNYLFTVEAADRRRIKNIKITLPKGEE